MPQRAQFLSNAAPSPREFMHRLNEYMARPQTAPPQNVSVDIRLANSNRIKNNKFTFIYQHRCVSHATFARVRTDRGIDERIYCRVNTSVHSERTRSPK